MLLLIEQLKLLYRELASRQGDSIWEETSVR